MYIYVYVYMYFVVIERKQTKKKSEYLYNNSAPKQMLQTILSCIIC